MYKRYFVICLFFCFCSSISFPQILDTTIVVDEVVVTAGKVPVSLSEVPRSILVISNEEIINSPYKNLQDLLSSFSGIDVKKRGPEGVQADLSIRGGSFEQTLLLVDGIRINDPQTAHNNLNIPLNLENIERIEILKGQASGIYGANALSGVINIISKKNAYNKISANISGGSFGYYQGSLLMAAPFCGLSNSVSFSKTKSDGYRYNTNFDVITGYASSLYQFNSGNAAVSAGYTDKKFGANSFYSDKYPNQFEKIKTLLVAATVNYVFDGITVTPKLSWRNNKDYYLLDFNNPSIPANNHQTNSYGFDVQSVITTQFVDIAIGAEYSLDKIKSSNLGDHNRTKGGISAGLLFSPFAGLKIQAGGYAYSYNTFGVKFWPGLDVSYSLSQNISVYASGGKSFRIPSFTELYYTSKAQKGNVNLHPEEAVSVETGLNIHNSFYAFSLCGFFRNGTNLIDWIKNPNDSIWRSENISHVKTSGFDVSLTFLPDKISENFFIQKLKISYTYLNTDFEMKSFKSQYVLDQLKHQLVTELQHELPFTANMNWVFRYEDRFNQQDYFITDLKLSVPLSNSELYFEANNLFNIHYLDITGIPMPGRWLKAGVRHTF